MIKLFVNIWPENFDVSISDFTEEYTTKLALFTDVEVRDEFVSNDVWSLLLLEVADKLMMQFLERGIKCRMGLILNYSPDYPGWMLVLQHDNTRHSVNPLVAKFFGWNRVESQKLLTFDEIMDYNF